MLRLLYHPPFRTSFSLALDDESLAESLKIQYGEDIEKAAVHAASEDILLKKSADGYCLKFRGEEVFTKAPLAALDRLFFENTEFDKKILALHGAAVEYKGNAYLFLAPTTGGKTTLTAFLTSKGFGYLTDDCILLDRETFEIYPSPRPIHLRRGGLEVLQSLSVCPPCRMVSMPPNERYVYSPKNVADSLVPLKDVFFLARNAIDRNEAERLPSNGRIAELLNSPITPYAVTGDYLRLLVKLSGYGCRRLHYSDMNFVKTLIEREAEI
ncbi:MAG: hypothetical protein E7655_00610 [Ruminococcaceae bacterium]|nr:hypothetical protein [Oscillospiraceae bacterium]